jgi:alpha-1,2-mannosyltransferase
MTSKPDGVAAQQDLGGEPATHPAGSPVASTRPVWLVVIAATAIGLFLRLYQLTRPGFLLGITEYDDGAYFGSAVRLIHGAFPYRDFVMVQPPGITLLMVPLALLAKATGTAAAFAVGRVLTACAGAAAVPLVGLLLRRRGLLAVTLACGLLAVFPGGINAAHTVLLEPWLVLFCLLGLLALFDGDDLTTSPRRLAWSGAAFGFAGAIKLWAVFPILVTLILWWRRGRWRPPLPYLGGLVAGFGIPVLPFFVLAPGSFIRDVVSSQLSRVDVSRLSVWDRLTSLSALGAFSPVAHVLVLAWCLAIAGFVAFCVLRTWLGDRGAPPAFEWFALLTAALVLASFLWPPDYYLHYGWFFAPFLALAVALPAARLTAGPRVGAGAGRGLGAGAPRRSRLVPLLCAAAAIAIVVMTVVQTRQEAQLTAISPGAAARRQIPAGACVLTDNSALTIVADRFTSRVSDCPVIVDAIGTDYALAGGRNGITGAGRSRALRAVWGSALAHAQYVWIACPPSAGPGCKSNRRIPWTRATTAYLRRHFHRLPATGGLGFLYARQRPRRI